MVAPTHSGVAPQIGEAPSRHVLYQQYFVAHHEMPETIGRSFQALYTRVAESGVVPVGPPFVIYLEKSEPGVRWDMQICLPVSSRMSAAPDFEYIELPATRIVSLLHTGPYDTVGEAYQVIKDYIAATGLTTSGPPREIYLSPPDVPADQIKTLVEQPIT